ncbi:riboflavin aldehyde-forming enzyme [Daedaleopsis nitida]|nr:riboflavin aldehyde-forming enzyme [Daedaleopsis nitida]
MSRFAIVLFLFTLIFTVFAAPSGIASDVSALEKRSRTGRGTWFNVGLGACGKTNEDSDKIIAVSSSIYGNGKYCDEKVKIKNTANGKTATATVRDSCPGCGSNDIDMSPSLFEELGSLDTGVLKVTWEFVN